MLPKENRLKKNRQFTYIYKHGQTKHSKFLSVSYIKTKYQPFKIGFTVSKKIGNSVTRSKVKRYLREIVRVKLNNIDNNYNYIFIAREGIDQINFITLNNIVEELLIKTGLYNKFENKSEDTNE